MRTSMTHTTRVLTTTEAVPLAAVMLVVVLAVVTTPLAGAQTFTVLYNFLGSPDGAGAYTGLVQDTAGNLYGTTPYGGNPGPYGTVFEVDTSGTETVLHNFVGGTDGCYPWAN